ncbi:MAG: hydroxymethylbilane synthase, partial [Acidiferrobacterales bacterium]|nr:hydroxymethylbilane synthase [Acidiferrobacterales bacterium]
TDIAIHSMKDVPVNLPDGLEIAVVCDREDPRDAFVSNHFQNLYALPSGSRVGTSSLRRIAQLKNAFPNLEFVELRGNVNTRLAKLDSDEYEAIILAAAGLIRLELAERIKQYISPQICLPAVGQGVVGIECRADDKKTKQLIAPLNSQESSLTIAAERELNARLEGGCQLPIAGFAEIEKGKIRLRAMVGRADGSKCIFSDDLVKSMTQASATNLGRVAAKNLLNQGASEILSGIEINAARSPGVAPAAVVLTREEKFLGNTPNLLRTLDYDPVHIEALSIEPIYDTNVRELFNDVNQFTDVLFVSRNSVELSVPMIERQSDVLKTMRVLAVGPETAQQLYKFGIDALVPDSGHGAEALLKVQQLQELSGRRILIVRGRIGLDWPAQEMRKRGAEVVSALCYEQVAPAPLSSQIDELFCSDESLCVKGIFLHSSISAANILTHVMKYPERLEDVILIVGSEQIAITARKCGWTGEIKVALSPSNKHMIIAFSGH